MRASRNPKKLLTQKQIAVLQLAACGMTEVQIARVMRTTRGNVHGHRRAAYRKVFGPGRCANKAIAAHALWINAQRARIAA